MSDKPSSKRETLLTLLFVIVVGGGVVFFLDLISFGLFTYVIAAVLGITLLGFLHYVLWGYSFSQQVAGEREEEELRRRMESENDF